MIFCIIVKEIRVIKMGGNNINDFLLSELKAETVNKIKSPLFYRKSYF